MQRRVDCERDCELFDARRANLVTRDTERAQRRVFGKLTRERRCAALAEVVSLELKAV
jgi:hypothetical protein